MVRTRILLVLLVLLALGLCGSALAQAPVLTGLGLSGGSALSDTLVVEGDSLHVLASYTSAANWLGFGPALNRDSLGVVAIHLYADSSWQTQWLGRLILPVDTNSIVIDETLNPHRMWFRVKLTGVWDVQVTSLQIEMGVAARDADQLVAVSPRRTSHQIVGTAAALNNPVDVLHTTYLRFRDIYTGPPVIQLPLPHSSIGRHFVIRYDQPENADSLSLRLVIQRMDSVAEPDRYLYPRDFMAGVGKTLTMDALALYDTTQFWRTDNSTSLVNDGIYRLIILYQDVFLHPYARDTVDAVRVDLATAPPFLYDPQLGSATNDSTVHVVYELPEAADSVWLTFTEIVDSLPRDLSSPHQLRIVRTLYGSGVHAFYLDGRNIGTASPYVEQSNRGVQDRLGVGVPYRVTLAYGDSAGNENAAVFTEGYVWPRDLATTPPTLLSPRSGRRYNANLWVDFTLPEIPLPGSVYLRLASSADPTSPHTIYLNVLTAGHHSLLLDATHFDLSDRVDSVTGGGTPAQNNALVDGVSYVTNLFYRDTHGNPEARAAANFTFDNSTLPITIFTPVAHDTLQRSSLLVGYSQPEPARRGSLKLILTQTAGPAPDLTSPHTLYLSDSAAGVNKSLALVPASLAATPGMDSLSAGSTLVPRGIYRLTLQYQDSLGNAAAQTSVDNLYFPSGATVLATGESIGPGLLTLGDTRFLVFRLILRTDTGETVLRGLRFTVSGTIVPADIWAPQSKLWRSVDQNFNEEQDPLVDHLDAWSGGDIVFDSFSVAITPIETTLFVTLQINPGATASHRVRLSLDGQSAIDCNEDEVLAASWPLGTPDVPLDVMLQSFGTEQDSTFGALRVQWIVASEIDNAGFRLSRRAEGDTVFQVVAGWNTEPELVGRGTNPTACRYQYTDRNLTPGRRYFYKLVAESFSGGVRDLNGIAEGVPRALPTRFSLGDAYPNPFNLDVNLKYVVPYYRGSADCHL